MTNGRIAFNVITSTRRADAANYGFDELMEHDSRYDRMEEFIDVCKALWSSVAADAFVWDRESGVVANPAKSTRSTMSAGSSRCAARSTPCRRRRAGRCSSRPAVAARHQGVGAFCRPRVRLRPAARCKLKHRKALDEALIAEGRDPQSVGILFSTGLVVAETECEAMAKKDALLG